MWPFRHGRNRSSDRIENRSSPARTQKHQLSACNRNQRRGGEPDLRRRHGSKHQNKWHVQEQGHCMCGRTVVPIPGPADRGLPTVRLPELLVGRVGAVDPCVHDRDVFVEMLRTLKAVRLRQLQPRARLSTVRPRRRRRPATAGSGRVAACGRYAVRQCTATVHCDSALR